MRAVSLFLVRIEITNAMIGSAIAQPITTMTINMKTSIAASSIGGEE